MRITHLYMRGIGPFADSHDVFMLNLDNSRVLLRGISGTGKSTALRAISCLWKGYVGSSDDSCGRLPDKAVVVMHICGVPTGEGEGNLLLSWGGDEESLASIQNAHPDSPLTRVDRPQEITNHGFSQKSFPNMLLLDASPHDAKGSVNIGDALFVTDDDVGARWVQAWEALYEKGEPSAEAMVAAVNRLLVGKVLEAVDGRLVARLPSGQLLSISQLSLGENRAALLCFCAACCLRQGGILLLDEPAYHLHPAQIMGLVTTLEWFCQKAEGQMILVSHDSTIWQRYEALGAVITLGPRQWEGKNDD